MERPSEEFDIENFDEGAFEDMLADQLANFRAQSYKPKYMGIVQAGAKKAIQVRVPFRSYANEIDRPAITKFVDKLDAKYFITGSTINEDPRQNIFVIYLYL